MADYSAASESETVGVVDTAPESKSKPKDEDAEILKASRDGLKICIEDEQVEREKMLDDLKFATLDQWPADIRRQREGDVVNGPRPCLTVDQINQYITQVSNDMIKHRPSIKTRPIDDKADVETAKIFQGLIRHIEDQSSAQIAYSTAGESAVTIGLGFFRITTDYVSPDSFDQELRIERIPDTFSVYLSAHVMPDGSDADEGWVMDSVPLETFKRKYPGKKATDADFAGLGVQPVWKTSDTVMVCEYFYKKYTSANLFYLADGRAMLEDEYKKLPDQPEITGKRKTEKVTVNWCKHSGCEVLDKRELKGKYIPIVEVVGKEKIVEGKRLLWGLVRPAKDSLRAFNYWISAMTEKMALAPKAPFVGAVGQFATQGDRWDKANVNNYSKLEYDPIDINGNALPAPRRQEPMQMEPAMAQMLQLMQNNVKSSLGMYKASIGDTESQQSGRAILALQKESDTGTMHFGENESISVTHCGRILVDLIPHYIDTKRALRILGEDGSVQSVQIDPNLKDAKGVPMAKQQVTDAAGKIKTIYNMNVGTYDVTVSTGPSYNTSRQEAATVMTDLANTAKDPVSAAILRYGAIKNSDFSGSEEITKMLKVMLPPSVQQAQQEGQPEMPPAAAAKMQQMAQGLEVAGQKIQELESGKAEAMAKISADHAAKMNALKLDEIAQKEKDRLAREEFEFNKQLEIDKATHAADLEERKAGAAHKIKKDQMDFEQQCHSEEQMAKETPTLTPVVQNMAQAIQDGVSQGFMAMNQTQQQMVDLLTQLLAAQEKPRNISLQNIRRDAAGNPVGATVTPTLQ